MDSVPHIVNNMFNQEKTVENNHVFFFFGANIYLITHRPVVVYMTGTPSAEIE